MFRKWLIVILFGIVISLWGTKSVYACAGNGCTTPSPTPAPTMTPYPTWTPNPTATPYPTITPLPTGAPETGPADGAEVPIILLIGGAGVVMRKIAANIW